VNGPSLRLSVIVPVYNEARTIAELMRRVRAVPVSKEIIVVDDCSTDGSHAILEGLAYALREGAERTTKRSGVRPTELRVAGGGSQSKAAMQITADIFGLPAARPHVYEASGLGAAIDAAVGVGLHPNFETAVAEMTRIGDVFEPNAKAQAVYDELYKEVYLKMYSKLRPLYQAMQEIK